MKRILICLPEIEHRQIAEYEVNGLKQLGYYVVITQFGGEKRKKYLLRAYVLIKNALSIRKLVSDAKIQLIYINTALNLRAMIRDFITLFLIRKTHSKIFLKTHGSEAPFLRTRNIIYKFMINKYSLWADAFGVLSTEEYRNFVSAGFPPNKVFITKNITNQNVYKKNKEFRLTLGNIHTPLLLFVARLIPTKGLMETIAAAIILQQKGYQFKLIVVGDGPERKKAEALVAAGGITSYVSFVGLVSEENTRAFYSNSDILVLPTYHEEGFPMAVFQSVTAGLPIITTKIRASADYLKEPDNCLWVEPRNPEMLANRLAYLISNADMCKQMSDNNKSLSALFSQKVVCEELDQIFKVLFCGHEQAVITNLAD